MSGERRIFARRDVDNPDRSFAEFKTAPASATPLALVYLEAFLDGKRSRIKATAALLGCSERTAKRITSKKRPYKAPLRMEWLYNICAAVGKPMGDLLGSRSPKTWQQSLLGWNHARNVAEALQFASDCALSIVYRALNHYQLTGSFSVVYHGGMPSEACILLSPAPEIRILGGQYELHRVLVTSEKSPLDQKRRMYVQHICPVRGRMSKDILTPRRVELILQKIHGLTKNLPAELRRGL